MNKGLRDYGRRNIHDAQDAEEVRSETWGCGGRRERKNNKISSG